MSVRIILLLLCNSQLVLAATRPTPAEFAQRDTWLTTTFPAVESAKDSNVGLFVSANPVPVQQNSRFGEPFNIGKTQYYRGLLCHAYSEIIVRLPSPGKTFDSIVGVDSNGLGTVIFSIKLDGRERFRSPVIQQGKEGVHAKASLDGAREFTLVVEDAGHGIAYDQAVWADAKVILENGQTVWLGDIPIIKGQATISFKQQLPFTFTYNGRSSADILGNWKFETSKQQLDENRLQYILKYTDPATGLEVRCVMLKYNDFPTVEWTVYFKNKGSADTPIIENIRALDTTLKRYVYSNNSSWGEFVLHYNKGEFASVESYRPLTEILTPKEHLRLVPDGGRATNGQMPFYNLSWHNEGISVVVGWPGQWAAEFSRDSNATLNILAGQELTHLKLHPGEEIRTPLMVLQFWKGDWVRAQNIWRQWMIAHNIPRVNGKLPQSQMSAYSGRIYNEMVHATAENQKAFLDRYIEVGLKPDYLWIDAGWYVGAHKKNWQFVGTWEVDTTRFPEGLRALSNYAHLKGINFLLWFEPERVAPGTWLAEKHPEWVLGCSEEGHGQLKKDGLLDLGNPQAWNWLTDHISNMITSEGIDIYRQDFNIDPLSFWRNNDANDRQGITENKHIVGYLAFWDELLRRHPGLRIDSCASGGRRNDLETLRRAVPLWRTDNPYNATVQQCQTYGISSWIPYYGTGTVACEAPYYGTGKTPVEPYVFWSNACPSLMCGFDIFVKDIDYPSLRKLFKYWRQVAPNYYGDYYPLTPYSTMPNAALAWQFNRPEAGEGLVEAFCRPDSNIIGLLLKLRDLEPETKYEIIQYDSDKKVMVSGKELMEQGLKVYMNSSPGTAIITYKKR